MNSIYNRTRSHNDQLSILRDRIRTFRQDLLGSLKDGPSNTISPSQPPTTPAPANFEGMMHSEFDHKEILLGQIDQEISRLSDFFHKPDGPQATKANY